MTANAGWNSCFPHQRHPNKNKRTHTLILESQSKKKIDWKTEEQTMMTTNFVIFPPKVSIKWMDSICLLYAVVVVKFTSSVVISISSIGTDFFSLSLSTYSIRELYGDIIPAPKIEARLNKCQGRQWFSLFPSSLEPKRLYSIAIICIDFDTLHTIWEKYK